MKTITLSKNYLSIKEGPQIKKGKKINRIIISGSSNSGKSYVASIFRACSQKENNIYVPHRFVTRPKRNLDTESIENTNISKENFNLKLKKGEIGPYWTRYMEKQDGIQRTEIYGFESDWHIKKSALVEVGLYIYSANNDFVRRMYDNKESNVNSFLDNSLIIYIDCPEKDRLKRMKERNDKILEKNIQEGKYRLGDDGKDVLERADIIITNSIINESYIEKDVLTLIQDIL